MDSALSFSSWSSPVCAISSSKASWRLRFFANTLRWKSMDLQQQLFRPIMEQTQKVLQAYSAENGFAVVFDVSSQANSIIYVQDVADITTEIIRRVDANVAKAPAAAPAAPKPAEPAKK